MSDTAICACLVLSVSSNCWCLGRAAVCDCGISWTFLLPFFTLFVCKIQGLRKPTSSLCYILRNSAWTIDQLGASKIRHRCFLNALYELGREIIMFVF